MENNESEVSVEKNDVSAENPKNVLFGTITYADDDAYENFIANLDINQSIFILVASANFAQAKGAFNILESEVLSSAIRVIRKNSKPSQKDGE
jgi:hypothetical protein